MIPVDDDDSGSAYSSLPIAKQSYTCSGVTQSGEIKATTSKVERFVVALREKISFFLSTETLPSGKTIAKSDSFLSRKIMGLFGKLELSLNFEQRLASTSVQELHSLFEDVQNYGNKKQAVMLLDKLRDVFLSLKNEIEVEDFVQDLEKKNELYIQIGQDIASLVFKYILT